MFNVSGNPPHVIKLLALNFKYLRYSRPLQASSHIHYVDKLTGHILAFMFKATEVTGVKSHITKVI